MTTTCVSLRIVVGILFSLCLSIPSHGQQFKFRKNIAGIAGTESEIKNPMQVAVLDDGTVLVADGYNLSISPPTFKSIKVFNSDGQYIRSFATVGTGPGQLNENNGGSRNLVVDRNGRVFIGDVVSLKEFNVGGSYVREWFRSTGGVSGFLVDRDNALWMSEYHPDGASIISFDNVGNVTRNFKLSGLVVGYGLAELSNGNYVCADASSKPRLIYFDNQGNIVKQISFTSYAGLPIASIASLTVDEKDNIYVLDYINQRVLVCSPDGNLTSSIDLSQSGNTVGTSTYQLTYKAGLLYVSEQNSDCVSVWNESVAPTSNLTISGTKGTGDWFISPTLITGIASDNVKVDYVEYILDSEPTVKVTGDTFRLEPNEGVHVLKFRGVDIYGNVEPWNTVSVKVDYTPPVTTHSIDANGLTATLVANDEVSMVSRTMYSIDAETAQQYIDRIVLPKGRHSVVFWSIDSAGNLEAANSFETSPAGSTLLIDKFQLNYSSTLGGKTISSTITLSTAQSTPTTINLGSDNANVVVPASITIDAGQTSKTFTIETKPVGAYTQTNITATLGTQTRTAQLDLLPPTARIRISPPVVSSESTAKATITLSGNAPTGGLVVELESDESAASVPSSITVAEGQKTATFNIVAGKVTVETYAYITATIDGVSSEASLTIRPKSIKPTTLSITESLVGGTNGTGTITLSDPAPEGGLDVDLATNNAAVSLPLVVKVAEGSKTANFTFSTSAVSSTITATVSAKANGATVTDTIEVRVRPLGTLVASPSTLPGKATGTLTLTLQSPTATPLTVNVTSSNAAVVLASKTITIAKGQSSGILKFTTALVGTDTTSTITCLSNGLEAKTDITVRSAKPSNVSLLPAVVLGGKGSVGTVTIDSAAPTSGLTVALSSSDSSAVVPSFVLVPSGKTSATFTITTSKVTSSKNVTITAQANGVSKTATLGVRILTIASISFNPVSVEGGVKANGLLTLTDVAPLGGMTVTLGSDKAGVTVPTSLLVPAGKSSVAFVASTSVTGSSYDATITGTANGETGSGTLKVLAPAVSSFALSSTSVKGGDKPLGTVKIAKASTVDVVVNLSSSIAAIASVPATVTIPKGQLLATFQVTTTKPSAATSVTLSANTGGLAKTVVLKVNP